MPGFSGGTVARLADALRNSLCRNRLESQPRRHHCRGVTGIPSASCLSGVELCVVVFCADLQAGHQRDPLAGTRRSHRLASTETNRGRGSTAAGT